MRTGSARPPTGSRPGRRRAEATSSVITASTPAAPGRRLGRVVDRPGGHGQPDPVGGLHQLGGRPATGAGGGPGTRARPPPPAPRRVGPRRTTSRPVGTAASTAARRRASPGQNEDTTTRSTSPARPPGRPPSGRPVSPGSWPGSVGRFLTSMFTTRSPQASRAAASRGTWAGSWRTRSRRSGPAPATTGSWCTARAPSAVSRTSSSTPSAPRRPARANASRVFSTMPAAGSGLPRWACDGDAGC